MAQVRLVADQSLDRGAVRNEDVVIVIGSTDRSPLWLQQSDHHKRRVLDPDNLTDRVRVAEKFLGRQRSEHGDLGGATHVLFAERRAALEGPISDAEIFG